MLPDMVRRQLLASFLEPDSKRDRYTWAMSPPANDLRLSRPPGHTILMVEDEVLIRLVVAEYLRDCGYRVHEAATADEAIAILESPDVLIDLVFTDIAMPGSRDGFGLAHWVRENRPGIQVVLTNGPARSAKVAGDLCEAGPMLKKPYDPRLAVDRIRQLLAKAARREGDAPAKGLAAPTLG